MLKNPTPIFPPPLFDEKQNQKHEKMKNRGNFLWAITV